MEENEKKAIVVKDIVPKFEISVEEAESRLKQLNKFIESQMKEGVDYGKVPGINKPTLFKSGAEKLENIYGLYHEFECLDKKEDWDKGFFFYRYKCKVFRRKDEIKVSEGIGSCNILNLGGIDKLSQKRAFVSAVLSACRVSSQFTQDVEDIKDTDKAPKCSDCGASISDSVNKFSTEKFGKPKCYPCQKEGNESEEVVM